MPGHCGVALTGKNGSGTNRFVVRFSGVACLGVVVFAGVAFAQTTTLPVASTTTTTLIDPTCSDRIGFDAWISGAIIGSTRTRSGAGPVAILGTNPRLPSGVNAAVVYDSSCAQGCSGGDADLGTPNEAFGGPGVGAGGAPDGVNPNMTALGNVLVVAASLADADGDGVVDDPNDQGGERVTLSFDFSGIANVTPQGLTLIDLDTDEEPAAVELLDADGVTLAKSILPRSGNNGVIRTTLPAVGPLARLLVTLYGSGAVDNLEFEINCDDGDPCTVDRCSTANGCVHEPVAGCGTTTSLSAETTTTAPTTTLPTATTTTVPLAQPICGDADGSGSVTAVDAARTLRFALGIEVGCPLQVCDTDGSGVIEAVDALRVLQHVVGLPVVLACR